MSQGRPFYRLRTYLQNDMTYSELIKHNGTSSSEKALEQRARRMAKRKGYHLVKVRLDDRPDSYLIVGDENKIVGFDLEGVLNHLAEK
jgi:hypothetical protein